MRQHRSRITRAAADIEHVLAGAKRHALDELCQHHGPQQCTTLAKRDIAVAIGLGGQRRRHKELAWHRFHCGNEPEIGDVGGANLPVHHMTARGRGIEHA